MPTYMTSLLKEKFERRPRVVVPEGCGVVTMTDAAMFVGVQLLYYSLSLSHEIDLTVFDIGMTDEQRDWCGRHGISVETVPEERRLFSGAATWQPWNKPYCLAHSPFPKTLWLDADVVVTGDLSEIFDHLRTQPYFVSDHLAPPEVMFNDPELYGRFPVPRRSPYPVNSGVIGVDKVRDGDILTLWNKMVERADGDPSLARLLAWHEQGALLWVLEMTGHSHLIRTEERLNSPVTPVSDLPAARRETPEQVIEMIRPGKLIKHFQGSPKPWSGWDLSPTPIEVEPDDYIARLSDNLKIFIIGHDDDRLRAVPERPYLERVNLNDLSIGEHQTNRIAESRIFLSNLPETAKQDYVGFASPRWDDKYAGIGVLPLGELHRMRFRLRPENVICAMRTDNVDGPLGDFDRVNWKRHMEHGNAGIMRYLDEIEEFAGGAGRGVSFWSNNFVCHRRVYRQFVAHWRKVYRHLLAKYGHNFAFNSADPRRTPAFVYEAITVHYFATRTDLNIIEARPAVAARD